MPTTLKAIDRASTIRMERIEAAGYRVDIHHWTEGVRKVKTTVRVLDGLQVEHHRLVMHFTLGDLRSHKWLSQVTNAVYRWVMDGDHSIR